MLWNCAAFGVNLLLAGLNLFSSWAVNTFAVLITVVPVVFVVAYDALYLYSCRMLNSSVVSDLIVSYLRFVNT